MNEFLKKYYTLFKENLTMIGLIPTLLGGVWQLFKLMAISSTMIRFFSFSQLVSDGIFILIFFIFPFLACMPFLKENYLLNKNSDSSTRTQKIKYLFLWISIILLAFWLVVKIIENTASDFSTIMLMYLYIISICLYFLFLIVIHYLSFDKKWIKISTIIFLTLSLLLTFISVNDMSKSTSNIINFNKILTELEQDPEIVDFPEILYFNDKYIFIKLTTKEKKQILIKKFDDLFDAK